MRLRLGLTFHHVFYAPYYVALQRGLFEAQGLELETTVPGAGHLVLAGQASGELDVALGGIMRSLVGYNAGEADFLEAPAQVAEALVADGSAVIVREMAAEAGPIPYSSYSARWAVLDTQADALSAMIRGHVATLAWMRAATGAEIWDTIAPS